MPNQLLQEAIDLIKAGDMTGAKTRVFAVLKTEPRNADAWYLAAYLLEGRAKQIQALHRALAINPTHTRARAALAKLQPVESLDDLLVQDLPSATVRRPTPPVDARYVAPSARNRRQSRRSLVPLLSVAILAVALMGATAVYVLNKQRSESIAAQAILTLTVIAQLPSATLEVVSATDTNSMLSASELAETTSPTPVIANTATSTIIPTDAETVIPSATITDTNTSVALSQLDTEKTFLARTNTSVPASSTPTPTETSVPTLPSSITPSTTSTLELTSTPTTALTATATVTITSSTSPSNTPSVSETAAETASATSSPSTGELANVITATALAAPSATPGVTIVSPIPSSTATDTSVPTETPTMAVTMTDTSVPTSVGTSVPGSQDSPIPQRQVYRFPGLGRMTIQSSWATGQTGLVSVKITFTCDRPASQVCNTSNFLFSTIGDSGASYEQVFESGIPEPTFGGILNAALQGGKSSTGYVGFQIASLEHRLVLHVSVFQGNTDTYFLIG